MRNKHYYYCAFRLDLATIMIYFMTIYLINTIIISYYININISGRAKSTPTKHNHSATCLPWGLGSSLFMSRQTYLREIYRTALILTECGWLQAKTHVSHVLSQTIFTLTRWHLSASPWQLFPLLSSWQVSIKDHLEVGTDKFLWKIIQMTVFNFIIIIISLCSIPHSAQRYPSKF